jgi:NAD(P)-dependent dehydrogenase (short-subunit alcohol dehydrogenase family)
MRASLQGKIALVTGGSSGIGLAIARRLVDEGAFVFITGRRRAELDAAIDAIGQNIVSVQADCSKLADLDHLFDTIKAQKGRVDTRRYKS